MKLDPIKAKVLCVKIIPNVNDYMRESFKLSQNKEV